MVARLIALWLISLWLLPPIQGQVSPDSLHQAGWGPGKLFNDHQPKRMWLRLDLLPLVQQVEPQYVSGQLTLAYEHKVRRAWSIVAQYQRSYHLTWGVDAPTHALPQARIDLGVRHYYQLPEALDAGYQANNLNGSYLSLDLGTQMAPQRRTRNDWYSDNFSLTALCGMQRQLMRFAFFDFNFGVRVAYGEQGMARFIYPIYLGDGWQVFPLASFRLGLGW